MFLRSRLDEELKEQQQRDVYVLRNFEKFGPQAAATLVSTTVRFLHEVIKKEPVPSSLRHPISEVLPTTEHILWSMESIGHAFTLPLVYADDIRAALSIYSNWLFEPRQRPDVISTNTDKFFPNIFCHISMLFQRRPFQSRTQFDIYISLCRQALNVYHNAASKLARVLTQYQWSVLLKILLVITDKLFEGSPSENKETSVKETLEPQCLSVLFDVWMRCAAQTTDPSFESHLWSLLSRYSSSWLYREWFIKQWSKACRALTRRLNKIHFAAEERRRSTPKTVIHDQHVNINWDTPHMPSSPFSLTDKRVIYTWHQMLFVVLGRNPNMINEPDTFLLAAQSVAEYSDCFLEVANANRRKPLKITESGGGNSILDTFGPWLFEVAQQNIPSFERGQSTALGALCRIFCTQHTAVFKSTDIAKFFFVLDQVLDMPTNTLVVAAVIQNCKNIFSCGLPGVRYMVPKFLQQLSYILEESYPEDLRHSAIVILVSLLPVENTFFLLDSDSSQVSGEYLSARNMRNELQKKSKLLLSALKKEHPQHIRNVETLIWGIHSQLYYEFRTLTQPSTTTEETSCPQYRVVTEDAIKYFRDVLDTFLKFLFAGQWNLKETRTALAMLRDTAPVVSIHAITSAHLRSAIASFIQRVCEYIASKMKRLYKKEEEFQRELQLQQRGHSTVSDMPRSMKMSLTVLADSIWCLHGWIVNNPWLVSYPYAPPSPVPPPPSSTPTTKQPTPSPPPPSTPPPSTLGSMIVSYLVMAVQRPGASNFRQAIVACQAVLRFILLDDACCLHPSPCVPNPSSHPTLSALTECYRTDLPGISIHHISGLKRLSPHITEKDIVEFLYKREILTSPFNIQLVDNKLVKKRATEIEAEGVCDRHVHHFLVNNRTVVSVIESEESPCDEEQHRTPSVVMIIRDSSGKYFWQTRAVNTPQIRSPESRSITPLASNAKEQKTDDDDDSLMTSPRNDIVAQAMLRTKVKEARPGRLSHTGGVIISADETNRKWIARQSQDNLVGLTHQLMEHIMEEQEQQKKITSPHCSAPHKPMQRPVVDEKVSTAPMLDELSSESSWFNDFLKSKGSFHNSRLLLSSLGIMTPSTPNTADSIKDSSSVKQPYFQTLIPSPTLYSVLSELDSIGERQVLTCSVLFRTSTQRKEAELVGNRISSSQWSSSFTIGDDLSAQNKFVLFMKEMASFVPVSEHHGFTANCTKEEFLSYPYYSDHRHEMIFHVPALMSEQTPTKRCLSLIAEDGVRVIWSDSIIPVVPTFDSLSPYSSLDPRVRTWSSSTLERSSHGKARDRAILYILIYPHSHGLFKIKIHAGPASLDRTIQTPPASSSHTDEKLLRMGLKTKISNSDKKKKRYSARPTYNSATLPTRPTPERDDVSSPYKELETIGPLLDDMVVSGDALPYLVRRTCINGARRIQYFMKHVISPLEKRQKLIHSLSQGFGALSMSQAWQTMFPHTEVNKQ